MSLLDIKNLSVSFPSINGVIEAVRHVSFTMDYEKVAIVGESGSGKSQTGRALLGLTRGMVSADRLRFKDTDLLSLNDKQWRAVRGQKIAMVMQDPKYSLNPVMSIKKQMLESIKRQKNISAKNANLKIIEMLEAVKIRDPQRVLNAHAHELSGGMGQRVMIAMMLLAEPELLIADEPTSALDVTVQLQVLAILENLMQTRKMGLIFISHDLHLVSTFCDRILVMYGGQIVESLAADKLYEAQHPYTIGLLKCLPNATNRGKVLQSLQRDPAWMVPQ